MFGLDFLKNLGAKVGQGVKKFGEMDDDSAAPRTPPFLPEGGGAKPQLPISQPNLPARPNLPVSVSPFATEAPTPYGVKPPMAPPKAIPSAEEIGGNPSPTMGIIPRPAMPPASMPSNVQPGNAAEVLDRRGVPLPALPGQRNPTPYSDINRERYDYNVAHMKRDENGDLTSKYKRDWKQVLANSLMGFAQGAQSVGPHGNALAGGLGGLGVGLGGSVASPQASTNYAFDTRHLPEIERQQAEAAAERQQEAARVKAEQDQLMGRAKIGQVLADTQLKQANAKKAGQAPNPFMHNVPAGAVAINESGKPVFTNPANPRATTPHWVQGVDANGTPGYYDMNDPANRGKISPIEKPMSHSQAVDEQRAMDGSAEEIARSSVDNEDFQKSLRENFRAGLTPADKEHYDRLQTGYSDDDILAKMPEYQRGILNGSAKDVPEVEVERAKAHFERLRREHDSNLERVQKAWEKAQNKAYQDSLTYTRGVARARAADIRTGKAPAPSQAPAPSSGKSSPPAPAQGTTRPRSAFNSQKFPGLKFE